MWLPNDREFWMIVFLVLFAPTVLLLRRVGGPGLRETIDYLLFGRHADDAEDTDKKEHF